VTGSRRLDRQGPAWHRTVALGMDSDCPDEAEQLTGNRGCRLLRRLAFSNQPEIPAVVSMLGSPSHGLDFFGESHLPLA